MAHKKHNADTTCKMHTNTKGLWMKVIYFGICLLLSNNEVKHIKHPNVVDQDAREKHTLVELC